MQPTAPPTTKTRYRPTRIAPETFLVHDHEGEGKAPVLVPLNTMVIRSREPVVVDTGMAENREQFLADVFGLVEPADVRWVYLSHDDVDHTGNVNALMEACPNATLILNWFMVERMGASLAVPPTRWRWIGDGESFDVGDRTLQAVRPPIFDSPTTRGLFDPKTGVYWAVDTFATPLPDPKMAIADLEKEFWDFGLMLFAMGAVSPWLSLVDPKKYGAYVDRVQNLDIKTVAACHSPVIEGPFIEQAFARVRQFPTLDPPEMPDQSVLDQIVAASAVPSE
jgi:flavorubredoxin